MLAGTPPGRRRRLTWLAPGPVPLLLLVLLLLLVDVRRADASGVAAFDRRADGTLVVYTGDHSHASALPLVYGGGGGPAPSSSAAASVLVKARFTTYRLPTAANASLLLALDGNRLWARWRYLRLTNQTATFSTSLAGHAPTPAAHDGRILCAATSGGDEAFCNAGAYRATSVDTGTLVAPNVTVVLDLDRPRGRLPAAVYLLLMTERVEPRGLLQTPMAVQSLKRAAAATRCVRLEPPRARATAGATTLTLCDDDVPYFDLHPTAAAGAGAADTLVIGALFWRRNVSDMTVDAWAGTLTVQYAATLDTAAIELAGTIVALVLATVVLGLLTTSPQLLTMGLFLERSLTHARVHHGGRWDAALAMLIGSVLLVLVFPVAAVLAWLGTPGSNDAAATPALFWFKVMLTAAGGAEVLLLVATLVLEVNERAAHLRHHRQPQAWRAWLRDGGHSVSVRLAWVQQMAYVSACFLGMALALAPVALNTTTSGDLIAVFTLLPILLVAILLMAYFTLMLGAVAIASRHSTVLTGAAALGQVVVLGFVVGVSLPLFVMPLVESVNPLFGTSWYSTLIALALVLLAAAAGAFLLLFEGNRVLERLAALTKAATPPRPPPS